MFFCQKLLFAVYYSSSMNQCIKKSYSEHAAVIYGNAMYQSKKYLQRSVLLTAYCLPRMEVSHTMLAIFLAPLYILINIYIVRWMILWMGACTHFFQTFAFRACFAGVYIFLSASLLTCFLIRKPPALHRFLKNTANYFQGTFLYILIVIVTTDLCRLILKHTLHPAWMYSRKAFVVTGAVCTLLIIGVSLYGIFNQWNIKTKTYDVKIDKQVKGMDSLKIVLLADIHFGYSIGEKHAGLLVKKINAEDPDLICIAGDIFDNEYEGIKNPKKTAAILRSLKSRYGVYACWGNHDLSEPILAGFTFRNAKKDYDDPRMRNFLESANIRLLDDETVLIDKRFYLTGRKDPSRCRKMSNTRKDPDQLTAYLDKTLPIIFMDHQPGQLDEVAAAGADLDLCGHTHDGQLFPLNIITGLVWENSCGYLKKGTMHNIVTSGAGIWGPNMRTATNSEICSITVHFYPARPNSSDPS